MTLMPKESAKLIAELAKNVFIEEEGVKELACKVLEGLKSRKIHVNNFSQHALHPNASDPRAVDWIFVLDTLNFCFWNSKNDTKWRVEGHTGYFALCAAVKRALDEGKPMVDPRYYSNISKGDLEEIFRGDADSGEAPLVEDRVRCLQQVGRVLIGKYNGSFVECVKSCNRSAESLLTTIIREFECFRDEADYRGHRVGLYKRAQILIADIWACFKGKDLGEFLDIDAITMFADYRVPQVLVHFGAMRYSNPLISVLQGDVELKAGCEEEIEIRGCSIEVVQRVRDEVCTLIDRFPNLQLSKSDCNAILIDHFLWDYRRQHAAELEGIPFHKVRSIYY